MRTVRTCALASVLALAAASGTALADDDVAALRAEIKRLSARLEKLEQAQAQSEKALQTERLSEKEPELVTRLKAVEFQTLSMQKQARQIEALEGITVGASLTSVMQAVNRDGSATGARQSRANYRGDVSVTLPGGDMGDIESKIFIHFRFGQGTGVGLRSTYTSTSNTVAFQTAANRPDDSFAILAQAWYQLDVPLPRGGFKPQSKERLQLTFGKMDPFVFFDQNAAADDETVRFMNNAFVHNPLLDSGGDVGADAYGFAPGMRLAYRSEQVKPDTWEVSLGAFGSGPGANFSASPSKPFVIAQLQTSRRLPGGLTGNYRAYLWRNGRSADFTGAAERHAGWGVSVDQRVGDAVTLFGRFGDQLHGRVRFDRAWTLGAELGGSYWSRAADALGIAAGVLRTSSAYRNEAAMLDLDGDGKPDPQAWGYERITELYYRFRVNSRFDLAPGFQWIQRPGGDGAAPSIKIVGVRARIGF